MMRTKDGLIHLVKAPQSTNYKGILQCGLLFRKESKHRTKWVPKGHPLPGGREIVAIRSNKRPHMPVVRGKDQTMVTTLADPADSRLVHATDLEGLVCRLDYQTLDGLDWPPKWWDNEQRSNEIVTCVRCVRWRR